jgi:hypothetical protein
MHFRTNFWRKSCSNRGSAKRCRPERATPRPRTRSLGVRARAPPNSPPPEVARRPRPTRPRPTRLPSGWRHAPRRLGLSAPRASPSPHRTRAVHEADRRSVRGPAVHTPAVERRSTTTSWPSSPRRHRQSSPALFKAPAFSSRPHRHSTASPWPPSR